MYDTRILARMLKIDVSNVGASKKCVFLQMMTVIRPRPAVEIIFGLCDVEIQRDTTL